MRQATRPGRTSRPQLASEGGRLRRWKASAASSAEMSLIPQYVYTTSLCAAATESLSGVAAARASSRSWGRRSAATARWRCGPMRQPCGARRPPRSRKRAEGSVVATSLAQLLPLTTPPRAADVLSWPHISAMEAALTKVPMTAPSVLMRMQRLQHLRPAGRWALAL